MTKRTQYLLAAAAAGLAIYYFMFAGSKSGKKFLFDWVVASDNGGQSSFHILRVKRGDQKINENATDTLNMARETLSEGDKVGIFSMGGSQLGSGKVSSVGSNDSGEILVTLNKNINQVPGSIRGYGTDKGYLKKIS